MKKKFISILSLLIVFAILFTSCGNSGSKPSGGKPEVNLWVTGSDNLRIIYETIEKEFNAHPDYSQICTLKVQFIATGSGGTLQDKVLAAYHAGQTNTTFDLIEAGDEQLPRFLAEGGDDMLVKYDASKIPNLANVSARPSIGVDVAVPYRGTTVVYICNPDTVPNPPKTSDELTQWIKDNPTRFSYNSAGTGGAGDAFIRSSIYNLMPEEALMSTDPKWLDEMDPGFDYLKEIHPYLYKSGDRVIYPNKNQGTLDIFNNREVDIIPAWADQAISGIRTGAIPANTKIFKTEPSLTGSVNSYVIPTFGTYPDEAHSVIDFMLTDEIQSLLLEEMAAIPLIDTSNMDPELTADIADLDVSNFRTQSIGDLGVEINRRWDEEIASLS